MTGRWGSEQDAFRKKISENGIKAFVENVLDSYQMNWVIKDLELMFPSAKRVFVDLKDQELYRKIANAPGKKIVVLVNQWHMEGIEHMWCHSYGQKPRSVEHLEINPIGDMDLRRGLFDMLWNSLQR